jgi:hypothetical protein
MILVSFSTSIKSPISVGSPEVNVTGVRLLALRRALRGGWKIITLRRASSSDFAASPELFAGLIILDLALTFVFSVIAFGVRGQLNPYELPRALMYVPLVLTVGVLARRVDARSELMLLPVAFAAASVLMTIITSVLYVLAQHQLIPFAETYWYVFDYVVLGWSAAIIFLAVMRFINASPAARIWLGLAAITVIVLPTFWLPQGMLWMPKSDENAAYATSGFHTLASEKAFYAQQGALERELNALQHERPGVSDIYLVAAALYAGEDVFMKDVQMISNLFAERFDAAGRTVTLINNAKTLEEHPVASLTSIRQALHYVGETINRDEDVLVLYVTSHGSEKHELVVDFRPLRWRSIDPQGLKSALDDSGIRWKVLVISACYSGGFIDALKDERTLVITAASADRTSFGCGNTSDATYLAQALFGQALRKTYSFEQAFGEARKSIEQWEREKGYTASEPQIYVGSEIRAKLGQIERRLGLLASHKR